MKKVKRILLVLILIIVLLPVVPALARKATLSNISVTDTEGQLWVNFRVEDCFTEEMNSAIESGIDTTFTFFVRLYEKKKFDLDIKLADIEISHSIKYDNLKKYYELRLSEKGGEVVIVKDFGMAKSMMAEVTALNIISLDDLEKNVGYQIRIMAELDKIRLPFYLHYIFFFLSLWDFETDWYVNDFSY